MIYSNGKILIAFLLVVGSSSAFNLMKPTFHQSTALDMSKKVFIDGEAGTTGLQVRERLSKRDDIEIISPPSELRKDEETRKKFINEADAVILCLPDAASIEAASWVEPGNDRTVLIDASTAFRVDDNWTYGFPGKLIKYVLVIMHPCAVCIIPTYTVCA
jgi:N-acetyl-gamma-glutamyl-phosphate reductase